MNIIGGKKCSAQAGGAGSSDTGSKLIPRSLTAVAMVAIMLLVSILPLIPTAGAVAQGFSELYRNDTDVVIPNGGAPVTSTIDVPMDITVTQVDVHAKFVHGRNGDLIVWVRSPTVGYQQIYSNPGDLGANLDLTVNDVPAFRGAPAMGTWTLRVMDLNLNIFSGNLDYWEITLHYDLSVSITDPPTGTPISGTYTVRAQVDNADFIELWMDGDYVSDMIYNLGLNRYEYDLDTTGYQDGMHNLQVVVEDATGHRVSDQMGVEVDNYAIFATIVAPGSPGPLSGAQTVWVNVPNYATWASLAVDGAVIDSNAVKQNFGGQWYFDLSLNTASFSDGDHSVSATAYDPEGSFAVDTLTYTFDNYAISCSIADPADGSTVSGVHNVKADVPATATRGELYVDGIMRQVDLTRDGLGQYSFSLDTTNYNDASHTLEVRAFNALGNSASDVVTVDFDNWDISAVIQWPNTGDTISGTWSVGVQVPAYASQGNLFVDGQLMATETTVQFGGWFIFSNWDTTAHPDGIHTIRVEVMDPDGKMAVDSESPTINNYDISVTMNAPSNGETISGTRTVRAWVPAYAVRGELFIDDTMAGVDTTRSGAGEYTFSLDTRLYDDGRHTIRVVAFDPDGLTASDSIWVDIDNYDITVNIQAPADGSDVSGLVTVRAQTQAYAIKGELYVDDGFVALDTTLDGSNRFIFQFDSMNYHDGNHIISVRVYDPDGNWNIDTISVNVDNYDISVAITNHSNGDTVSDTISLRAAVPSYSQRGDLYIDNEFIQRTDVITGGEYRFDIDTRTYDDGAHLIQVVAMDPDGNDAVDTISLTFDNWDISVSFIWPTSGTTISGSGYNVWVQTDDYSTRGELYIDGELVDTQTSFVFLTWYQFTIDTDSYKDGYHTMSARAYDPDGNFAADTISVIVDNYAIWVSIDRPANGATVSGAITVDADVPSYATYGECYLDDRLVNSDYTISGGQFSFSIDTVMFSDTGHTIKVIAYDPEGSTAMDTINIIFDNWDISVNIFTPSNGATVMGTSSIRATVPSYAAKGELYIDDDLVMTDTTVTFNRFDFSLDTTSFMDGSHKVQVKAYDPDGIFAIDTITLLFDNYDLSVTITSPTANSIQMGSISVRAQVGDDADSARLYVDSLIVATSYDTKSGGQSYTFSLDTRAFADGSHLIRVEATYSVSGESVSGTIPLSFDNTPPDLTGLNVVYLTGLTAVRASGDQVIITAEVDDDMSGVNNVLLDATNIGGGASLSMFDDGNHDDGESGDGVYGSDPIDASGKMGHQRTFVTATDNVGNAITKSISVAVDDRSPLVTNTYVIYPIGQKAAKLGDQVRVIANVIDTRVYVDIVLVMDTSGSMSGTPIANSKTAAKSFVDQVDANDQVAVYSFNNPAGAGGNQPKQEIGFTKNKVNVKNRIDALSADDWTPLYDTAYAAIQYAKTSNNMPVVILLTDGNDCIGTDAWGNCNEFSSHPIDDIKDASIPVFTIGLDPGVGYDPLNEAALKGIAESSNGGAYYYAPSSSDLKAIYEAIATKVEDLEVGGIAEVVADLDAVGSGKRNLMYDDGNHADGLAGDNIFGTNLVSAGSMGTDKFTYYVNATDVGGNTDSEKGDILIDNTPPTISNIQPVYQVGEWWGEDGDVVQFTANVTDAGNVGGIVTVTIDATSIGGSDAVFMRDDGLNGDVAADDGTFTSAQITLSTGLKTGLMDVSVAAIDIAANSATGGGSIYIDNHRPMDVQLVKPTADEFIEGTYTFRASANNINAIDRVEMYIDSYSYIMAYNAQTSYYELEVDTTDYTDGDYTSYVDAFDIAGRLNTGATNMMTFYIDNTPPVLFLNSPSEGDILNGYVAIDTDGTNDTYLKAVEYKVDDLPWVNTSVLWDTTTLVDGDHTVEVRAVDEIGHVTSRTIHIIIDNGNPEAYFVTPRVGEVLSDVVSFQVKATDLVLLSSVKLTGAIDAVMEYSTMSGYYEVDIDTTMYDDGYYAVGAEVKDIAGHILYVPSVNFSIDNDGPDLTIIRPMDGEALKGTEIIELNVTDGPFDLAKVEWRVGTGSWQEIVNTTFLWNTTVLADGWHTLTFRAIDHQEREVQESISVIIDNHAPSVELIQPMAYQIIEGRYLFKIHSYDEVGVEMVKLDIEGVNTYTLLNTEGSSYFEFELNTLVIQDGPYNVTVTSYDISGYVTTATMVPIRIDNTAPGLVVYYPMSGDFISGQNYTISGKATDMYLSSVEYNIDGFGLRSIDQPLDTTLLAEGEHVIQVIAMDMAGHTTTTDIMVIVDNHGPGLSPVTPQDGESISGRYTFRVRAEDANGVEKVSMQMGNTTIYLFQNALTGYYEVTRDTTLDAEGNHTYIFKVVDRSGKEANLTLRTLIDNTGPSVTVMGPKDEIKGIAKFRIQVSDPSGVDRVLIRIGGGEWREMRYEEGQYVYRWKTTEEDNGDQPYDIKVVDKLGNEEILAYSIVVNNPTEKKVLPWWVWLGMLCILIGVVLGVAVASRPTTSSRDRMRERTMDRRMAGRDAPRGRQGPAGQRLQPGRARGDPHKIKGKKELTTPAHRAAMRKLESEDVVVQKPQEDEVQFLSMDEGPGADAPRAVAVAAPLRTVSDLDDDVEFHEDDDVSFDEDDVTFDEDEVEFHDDEVSFHEDEVSFEEDEDVEFLDDDDEVDFLDDGPPPPGPPSRTPAKRVSLTPRATATPARPSSPPVSSSTMKGIDDLLAGPPKKGPSAPSRLPKASPPTPKRSTSSSNDDPLGDVIGSL